METCLRENKKLSKTTAKILTQLTHTSNVSEGLIAITSIHDKSVKDYHEELLRAAPYSLSHFVEYMTPEEPPARHHDWLCSKLEDVEQRKIMNLLISMPPGFAKALSLDTKVPTPSGPSTIKDLSVGDFVFSVSGKPVRITHKSEVFYNNRCFKVTTADGREVVCDADHLWNVKPRLDRKGYVNKTTLELFEQQERDPENFKVSLPKTKAAKYERTYLPIDPLILGMWLSSENYNSGTVFFTRYSHKNLEKDLDQACRTLDHTKRPKRKAMKYNEKSLSKLKEALESQGLLNNAHIPEQYFYASHHQKKKLLDGFLKNRGRYEPNGDIIITLKSERVAKDLRRLLFSMGRTNKIVETDAIASVRKQSWTIIIADGNKIRGYKQKHKKYKDKNRTYIKIEEVPSVPTQCIKIDDPDGLFLVEDYVPTHNTKFCSRYFPAWYLGRNPKHRYLQCGHTSGFCTSEFGKVTRNIVKSQLFGNVFPEVNVESGAPNDWQLTTHPGAYVTKGVGEAISGYRGHCGAIDDPYASRADAESPIKRQKINEWFFSDFLHRLLPNSPAFIIATRWNPRDLIGTLEEMTSKGEIDPWETINLPAVIETQEDADKCPLNRKMGEGLWPEYYTPEMMANKKATIPARDWNSLFQGKPVDEEGQLISLTSLTRYDELPPPEQIRKKSLSIDTAKKKDERSDFSAISVWYEDMNHNHYLVNMIRKRVNYNELERMINQTAINYGVDQILIEDAGMGTQYIQRYTETDKQPPAPVIEIKLTNKSKEFRFDGVVPMIEAGTVLFPSYGVWLPDFEREMMDFPTGDNDDQVDTVSQYLHYVSPNRRLGSKKLNTGAGTR